MAIHLPKYAASPSSSEPLFSEGIGTLKSKVFSNLAIWWLGQSGAGHSVPSDWSLEDLVLRGNGRPLFVGEVKISSW